MTPTRKFVVTTLFGATLASSASVQPVTSSRNNRVLTAVTESGQTSVAARDLEVDLVFPDGVPGKGQLYVVFAPSIGFYLHLLHWSPKDYYRKWIDQFEATSRFGVTADNIVMLTFSSISVGVQESTDTAVSMDDAEAKSLQWVANHLAEIEARTDRQQVYTYRIDSFYPRGFLRPEPQPGEFPVVSASPSLPVKLLDVTYRGGGWELALENTETHKKATLHIRRCIPQAAKGRQGGWCMGNITPN